MDKGCSKRIGITPICCSYNYDQASFFGNPCVVIPETNFKMYQNPNVNDLKSVDPSSKMTHKDGITMMTKSYDHEDKDVQEVVDGYMEDYSNRNNEILLKCNTYYLLNVRRMLWMCRNNKYNKIKEIKELKTYKQLIDFIYNFNSFLNYVKSRKPR